MPDEPLSVACPSCNVRLKLKDSSAVGKTIKCPKCASAFTVPAPAPAAVGATTRKKKPPAAEAPPDDEGDEEAEDAPKKKKKKKKKKKAAGPPLGLIVAVSAFAFLLVGGGVVAAIIASKGAGGRSSAAVGAPELQMLMGPTYSFLAPKGWPSEDGGAENHKWYEFNNGGVKIRANDDTAGVGDIISGPNRGERLADHTQEVIHGVHLGKREVIEEDFGDYQEDEPVPFSCKMGMGRWSAFSGATGVFIFKTKLRGIRATVQSNTRTMTLRCVCPESMWETFKPIFEKIVTSVGPGQRA